MLTPEYLQNVPDNMIKLYAQAEADILADMARRISTYDYWIPAAEHQAKMLEEAGMTREEIIKRLKKLTGKTQAELKELMKEAGTVALKSDDEVYKRNGLDPPPIGASKDLQQILQAGYDKTAGTFQNLTMTTVRTATRQFEQALDRAYMEITMGGFDYNTAIRSAIKQLSADGVGAIRYPSGKIDTIEVAVRRATITGVNQTALKLQDTRADEMGCDLVEVSAHSGARPEHAAWQGEIYSRSGKSKKYPDFVKATGYGTGAGLGGWNCSHSFRPWFEGMSRTYSEGLLEDYEAKKFEYNGKKLTEYEALQEQRHLERQIRRWKREQNALQAAGLDTSEATAKIREWNRRHKDFLEQTGLKPDGTRTVVGKATHGTKWVQSEKGGTIGFKCYGDYLREVLGSAKENNAKEVVEIVDAVKEKGGWIDFIEGKKMVTNIFKGKPGSIEVDENISITGLKHEFRHFMDDMDNGNPGLAYYLMDRDKLFEYEKRGYAEELAIARENGYTEIEKRILRNL